jgi:hypothetical protein
VLFIEYDVTQNGEIELVALINAVEEDGQDPDGSAWLSWRSREFEDHGMGCVAVPRDDLTLMEATKDATELCAIVERIILADRAGKEEVPS